MDLKRVLSLLLTLEAAGKLEGRSLPALYDPNGDITLTVRADTVATREQFLADVAGTEDEAEVKAKRKLPTVEEAAVAAGIDLADPFHNPANDKPARKPAKLGGKKGK